MVLVLTGVAVIMGAILAWVNSVTSGPIADQKEKALADGIKAVMQCDELTVTSTDTVKQPDNKGKELTFVVYHTQLRVLVGFNPDGTILGYTLLEHAETPGLGAKADKWFQADGKGSIIGLTPAEPLVVSKDGGQVDAITASTITSRAFLKAVNNAYNAYKKPQADGETGASEQIEN